ncbi:MAG TPA: biopolymer transporter ExbD [Longimicrobiaceae bacterium]|nr:biopolymer transporter ExbD [Longimicrobiaceae bacterium]
MGVPASRTAFEPSAEINVTPMIDVMLVLLIIFMVVTPSITSMALLPKAATAVPEKEDRVTLGIDEAGRYFLDGDRAAGPIAPEELEVRLRAAYARRPPEDHVLYLKADKRVPYARVLTAVDAARQAGVSRIGAITELEPRPRRR